MTACASKSRSERRGVAASQSSWWRRVRANKGPTLSHRAINLAKEKLASVALARLWPLKSNVAPAKNRVLACSAIYNAAAARQHSIVPCVRFLELKQLNLSPMAILEKWWPTRVARWEQLPFAMRSEN